MTARGGGAPRVRSSASTKFFTTPSATGTPTARSTGKSRVVSSTNTGRSETADPSPDLGLVDGGPKRMPSLEIADLRVFVPSSDMDTSKAFYTALGWKVRFDDGHLALLASRDSRFYLNEQFPESYAKHFRLHFLVEDAQAWFEHVSAVRAADDRFSAVVVKPPQHEDYGAIVTFAYDPSGVLLDFSQRTTSPALGWVKNRVRARTSNEQR
jgi:catechol 2,3-dioxygenase-like lactoylglutathione lyase family enzyme